jgi:uncharacterized protein YjaZ
MQPTPLEQLYLETTSKEDLLAEINDQRRQVIEARGEWSAAERELQELRKKLANYEEMKATIKRHVVTISKYRKRLGISDAGGIKRAVFSFIADGLTNAEIAAKGYKKETIERYRCMYNAINKAGN